MQKEQATRYIQDRRIVYERLYQQGLEYLNKKAILEKKIGEDEDPQCTFKPNISKTKNKRKNSPFLENSPLKESRNRSLHKVRKLVSQGKLANKQKSPLSRYAIKKEIENISVKGMEKSFLEQARQAAQKRSKEFDERFGKIKKANDQRKILSPRNKLNLTEHSIYPISPNLRSKRPVISIRSKSPRSSYTPKYQLKNIPSFQNMKFPLVVDESYLQEAIKICIEKAYQLSKKNQKVNQKSFQHSIRKF